MSNYNKYIDLMLMPNLIHLSSNLILAQFKLMKLLPAIHIIENAIKAKIITKDTVIIESSSGSMALGLALVCNYYNLKLEIITDPAMDPIVLNQVLNLGTKTFFVDSPDKEGGYQTARLRVLQERMLQHKLSFWPQQYSNKENLNAYSKFADYLIKNFGVDIVLVGTVGSGGSTGGTIQRIRQFNKSATLIGVDSTGSILFGQPDKKRLLRGVGNSIMPKNVKHEEYDEIHFLEANEAFIACRQMHKEYGIFSGPTTGAAFMVSKWYAKLHSQKLIIFIGPDEGYRYADTIYNDVWMKDSGLNVNLRLPKEPLLLINPEQEAVSWSRILWGRKRFNQMCYKNKFAVNV